MKQETAIKFFTTMMTRLGMPGWEVLVPSPDEFFTVGQWQQHGATKLFVPTFFIYPSEEEAATIGGTRKVTRFNVTVLVSDPGNRDEPPSEDEVDVENGLSTLEAALRVVIRAMVDNEINCAMETAQYSEQPQEEA